MDIGRLINNTKFYDGFEDEREVTLVVSENPEFNLHIWEGYFDSFFNNPPLDGHGWHGFTRDYNQMERTCGGVKVPIDLDEYLKDFLDRREDVYPDDDYVECYALVRDFLQYARDNQLTVLVSWED